MSAVHFAAQAQPYANASAHVKSDNRIAQVSKSIFQKAQEAIVCSWHSVATLLHAAGDKMTFIFFGVIECICPVIGPKIHNAFLYSRLTVESYFNAQTVDDMNEEIEILEGRVRASRGLQKQNDLLAQELRQIKQENERLNQENGELNQASQAADQRIQWMLDQQPNLEARQQAVLRERDLMIGANAELHQRNETLVEERNTAQQKMLEAIESKQTLEHELALARQETADLRVQLHEKGEVQKTIHEIHQTLRQIPGSKHKTGLDDSLEDLLSQLLRRIGTTRELLQKAKEKAAVRSPIEVPLRSFEGELDELTELLNTVPQMFHLHSRYNDLVNLILQAQPLEV